MLQWIKEHPMQGLMVWFRSVWPSLPVWCITFGVLKPSNFLKSKVITQCRSAIFVQFGAGWISLFLHSLEHPMQGLLVWFRSVWPSLPVWCITFGVLKPSNFLKSKVITQCWCTIFVQFGAGLISLFLHSLEHPMQGLMVWFRSVWPSLPVWCITFGVLKPSNFLKSKVINPCRSAILVQFGAGWISLFLHSLEHPMQGLMVWFWSVWPSLPVWCITFSVLKPSKSKVPSVGVRF